MFVARNMIFFSSQKQFFQKINWQWLSLLSIFELKVKQIWQYYCQGRFSLGLGKSIGSSIILHNYPPSQSFYFPAQFYSKITLFVFFLHPSSKAQLTWRYCKIFNSSYRESYLFKFGDRHILHSSRTKLAFFDKLPVQKTFSYLAYFMTPFIAI